MSPMMLVMCVYAPFRTVVQFIRHHTRYMSILLQGPAKKKKGGGPTAAGRSRNRINVGPGVAEEGSAKGFAPPDRKKEVATLEGEDCPRRATPYPAPWAGLRVSSFLVLAAVRIRAAVKDAVMPPRISSIRKLFPPCVLALR